MKKTLQLFGYIITLCRNGKKDTELDKIQKELLDETEALNKEWRDLNNQMKGKLEQITEYINSLKKG